MPVRRNISATFAEMRSIILFLPLFGLAGILFGQGKTTPQNATPTDTILFVDGEVVAAHVTDTSGDKITFEKPRSKKHKKIEVDMENVFSIRYASTGKEILVYNYDTLIGNDYTVADARLFIAGERDAQRGYKCRSACIAAFAIGVGSGITGASLFVLLPPYFFTGILGYTRIKINHNSVSNLDNVKFDPYLYGYGEVAKRKRTFRTLLWGGVGVTIGVVIHFAAKLNN